MWRASVLVGEAVAVVSVSVSVRMRGAAAVCMKTQDSVSVGQRLSVSRAYAPVRVVEREAGPM